MSESQNNTNTKLVQHHTVKKDTSGNVRKLLSFIIRNKWFVCALIILAVILASVKDVNSPPHNIDGGSYTKYNNYVIFKTSYFHLLEYKNIYQHFPEHHFDLYKYSPTFSMSMVPFAYLPDVVGLTLWNLLNAIPLIIAILFLPRLNYEKQTKFLWLIAVELLTSIQNEQSNGLMASLIMLSFIMFEKEKLLWAALFIAMTFYLKIFGLFAGVFIFLYPNKIKSTLYLLMWLIVLGVMPAAIVGFNHLVFLYESWYGLVVSDHSSMIGMSAMALSDVWLHIHLHKLVTASLGLIIFIIPFFKLEKIKYLDFRLLTLASVLLFLVLFNHKAESPTFVIAVAGVGVWYFSVRMRDQFLSFFDFTFLILVIIFTILSPTDIFPGWVRENYVKPYLLKTLPCFLVWLKVIVDMLRFTPQELPEYKEVSLEGYKILD